MKQVCLWVEQSISSWAIWLRFFSTRTTLLREDSTCRHIDQKKKEKKSAIWTILTTDHDLSGNVLVTTEEVRWPRAVCEPDSFCEYVGQSYRAIRKINLPLNNLGTLKTSKSFCLLKKKKNHHSNKSQPKLQVQKPHCLGRRSGTFARHGGFASGLALPSYQTESL